MIEPMDVIAKLFCTSGDQRELFPVCGRIFRARCRSNDAVRDCRHQDRHFAVTVQTSGFHRRLLFVRWVSSAFFSVQSLLATLGRRISRWSCHNTHSGLFFALPRLQRLSCNYGILVGSDTHRDALGRLSRSPSSGPC